jgi:hypothetical protein
MFICMNSINTYTITVAPQSGYSSTESNWNVADFYDRRKVRRKPPKQQTTLLTYDDEFGNQTRATMVRGKRSHHYATHASIIVT